MPPVDPYCRDRVRVQVRVRVGVWARVRLWGRVMMGYDLRLPLSCPSKGAANRKLPTTPLSGLRTCIGLGLGSCRLAFGLASGLGFGRRTSWHAMAKKSCSTCFCNLARRVCSSTSRRSRRAMCSLRWLLRVRVRVRVGVRPTARARARARAMARDWARARARVRVRARARARARITLACGSAPPRARRQRSPPR